MEHISNLLPLAGIIPMGTSLEVNEPYILTEEEENKAIENEIVQLKEHFRWKAKDKGLSIGEAELRISQTDWMAEIDKDNFLQKTNSNKQYQIWQKQQRENEKKEEIEKLEETKNIWTAGMMLKLIRWTSENDFDKKLIEDENTMPLIKAVCFFLSEDERFETELGFSLKKGLWIRGTAGLGKTHVIRCVEKNGLNPIDIFSMIEISEIVKEEGEYVLPTALSRKIYLDDVGSEEAFITHYGTRINWFKDFLETFYLRSKNYAKLIVSTNYNFDLTEKKYGFRIRSRIKDMFNIIDVQGKDLRG